MTVTNAKKIDTPKRALIYLHDEAKKEDEEIATIVYKVKVNNLYKENISSLHKCNREQLSKVYAWLMKIQVDDEDIVQMSKEGLKKMIIWRMFQITAEECRSCLKMVHLSREEEYLVTCWECGKGACKDCYPTDLAGGKNWRYLCCGCLDTIGNLRGFQSLKADVDLLKVKAKKKAKKPEEDHPDDEEIPEEEEDPSEKQDDSCVFTDGTEKPEGEATESDDAVEEIDDPEKAFVAPADRRGFVGNKLKTTLEKNKKKTKTCSFFLQGRCKFGMSGKRPIKGEKKTEDQDECPYDHPRVCSKLLNHGDSKHTKYGCDGNSCKKAHPAMCTASMSSRQCWKACRRGWHVKGTNFEDGEMPVQKVRQQQQRNPNISSPHDFPPIGSMQPMWNENRAQPPTEEAHRNSQQPMQPMWNKKQVQPQTEDAHRIAQQTNVNVPPPQISSRDNNFKCTDCTAEFKYANEFKRHMSTEHRENETENDASFLGAVEKSLMKILPKALESCLNALAKSQSQIPNPNPNHQTGNNNLNLRWGLVPANLN